MMETKVGSAGIAPLAKALCAPGNFMTLMPRNSSESGLPNSRLMRSTIHTEAVLPTPDKGGFS